MCIAKRTPDERKYFQFLPSSVIFSCLDTASLRPGGISRRRAFTAVSASSSSAAIFPAVLAVIFGIVSLFGEMLLILYMQTASAVFYSGATGNFRSSGSGGQSMPEDKTPQDISGPSNTSGLQNPDTPKDAEPAALTGSRPSGGAKTSGTASAEPDTDSPSDSDGDSDETLSILETTIHWTICTMKRKNSLSPDRRYIGRKMTEITEIG